MKEARIIVNEYDKIDFSSTKAALATVVHVKGSSYRRMGARMLILDNGNYFGGISGGCLEKDVLRKTVSAIIQNKNSLLVYDTTQDDEYQPGVPLGCNGIIEILITPLNPADEHNPVHLLSKIIKAKETGAILTVTGDNKNKSFGKSFLYENTEQFLQSFEIEQIAFFVLKDINNCLETKTSKSITYNYEDNEVTVFIEVISPDIQLVIYGGNYDIYPLARMAKELGWNVSIVSGITKAAMALISDGFNFHPKEDEEPQINKHTAIILMSHDYKTDLANFQKVLNTNAFYIGLLGPRKRSQKMFDFILNTNSRLLEEKMNNIFAPAGLDIGAMAPEEIALSILAEIKGYNAGSAGTPLRLRSIPIHTSSL